ncbi:MAG: M20 family metallopeptidase [Anaerocolumna sp.]
MKEQKRKLLSAVNKNQLWHIAEDLISLESEVVSGNEKYVAQYVFDFFQKLGLHPKKDFCSKERFNVVVEIPGSDDTHKRIMYIGHLDVVPAGVEEQWTSPPYIPEIRDGRMYGRGSCDMKGSIACSMYATELLIKNNIELKGSLLLVYDVDEENSNLGLKKYLKNCPNADFVIVGEPTNMQIALGHRGVMAFTVSIYGKSAHAAQPQQGNNAVYAVSFLIKLIQELNNKLAQNEEEYIGAGSIQVTKIEGGTKVNIIPDLCKIRIDRRLIKGENKNSCTAQLQDLLEQMEKVTGCKWDFEITTYCPPGKCEENLKEIQVIKNNIVELYTQKPVVKGFEASCEAGLITEALGIPAVIFGPGSIEQAHHIDEYITLDQLEKGISLYIGIFYDILTQSMDD